MSKEHLVIDWEPLFKLLKSTDVGIQQAMVLTLGTHRVGRAEPLIEGLLNSEDLGVRYAAARVLINFKNDKAIPLLKSILALKPQLKRKKLTLDARKIESLKLNVLMSLKKEKWKALNEALKKLSEVEGETKVALKAMEVLKELKN
jgi:HEAT repeat protein